MSDFTQGVLGTIAAVVVVIGLAMIIARWLSRPVGRGKRPRP